MSIFLRHGANTTWQFNMHVREMLTEPEFSSIYVMKNFHDINNEEDFWMWIDEVFIPAAMPDRFMTDGKPAPSYIDGGVYVGRSFFVRKDSVEFSPNNSGLIATE